MRLEEIIDSAKGGVGYVGLAARDPEARLGSARLQQLHRNGIQAFPHPDSIASLAVICGVSQQAIVEACAESLGIPWPRSGSEFARLLPPNVDQIPREARSAVLSLIRFAADASPGGAKHERA